ASSRRLGDPTPASLPASQPPSLAHPRLHALPPAAMFSKLFRVCRDDSHNSSSEKLKQEVCFSGDATGRHMLEPV
ncbi:hypothetical protein MUK42_35247, partial [Musa troglodytarum]